MVYEICFDRLYCFYGKNLVCFHHGSDSFCYSGAIILLWLSKLLQWQGSCMFTSFMELRVHRNILLALFVYVLPVDFVYSTYLYIIFSVFFFSDFGFQNSGSM